MLHAFTKNVEEGHFVHAHFQPLFRWLFSSRLELVPWTSLSCRTFHARGTWSTKLTTKEESDWNKLVPRKPVPPSLPNAQEKKPVSSLDMKTSKWAREIEKLKNLQKFSVSGIWLLTLAYADHWKAKIMTEPFIPNCCISFCDNMQLPYVYIRI